MQPDKQGIVLEATSQVRTRALHVIQETLKALRTAGEIPEVALAPETVWCLQANNQDKTFNWWN